MGNTTTWTDPDATHANTGGSVGAVYVLNGSTGKATGGDVSTIFDGESGTGIMPAEEYVYNSGGPPLASGSPSQLQYDRVRSVQGKATGSGNITTPTIGDTQIVFGSAPKTITPGQAIRLIGGTEEYVYVTDTFAPSATATTIPLKNAVVNASHTSAQWDTYMPQGPGMGSMLPTGLDIMMIGLQDGGNTPFLWRNAGSDGVGPVNAPYVAPGLYNPTNAQLDRQRAHYDNFSVIASGTFTSNQTSSDQTNVNGKGVLLYIKTGTFGSGASAIVVTLQGKDPVSNSVYTILASASLTASSFTVLRVYPGLTAAANSVASDVLPRTWNVVVSASNWGTGGSVVGVAACVLV